jgi:hypothetical protein
MVHRSSSSLMVKSILSRSGIRAEVSALLKPLGKHRAWNVLRNAK